MNKLVFTILDKAAGAFLDPFFSPTVETAARGFRELVQTPDHQFNKFPEDYSLYCIGKFSGDTGEITSHSPQTIAAASSLLGNINGS